MKFPLVPDGLISRAVRNGLLKRKELLAQGMPEHEADLLIGRDLKRAWEVSSKQPSDHESHGKYLCGQCFDSGWIVVKPSYWEQLRLKRMYGENPPHQDYMKKCDPCPWLDREREKRRERDGDADDDFSSAAQTKRHRGDFSKGF